LRAERVPSSVDEEAIGIPRIELAVGDIVAQIVAESVVADENRAFAAAFSGHADGAAIGDDVDESHGRQFANADAGHRHQAYGEVRGPAHVANRVAGAAGLSACRVTGRAGRRRPRHDGELLPAQRPRQSDRPPQAQVQLPEGRCRDEILFLLPPEEASETGDPASHGGRFKAAPVLQESDVAEHERRACRHGRAFARAEAGEFVQVLPIGEDGVFGKGP